MKSIRSLDFESAPTRLCDIPGLISIHLRTCKPSEAVYLKDGTHFNLNTVTTPQFSVSSQFIKLRVFITIAITVSRYDVKGVMGICLVKVESCIYAKYFS
jgi:hypothetical protein